jgi:pimeloyl-ACP methyl ester carboxylesterase
VLHAARRIGGRVHLFGHSLGGAVSVAAAAAEPDRFVSMFLFEPIVPPTRMRAPVESNPMATSARKRAEVFASRVGARERFKSRVSLGALHDEVLAATSRTDWKASRTAPCV